MAVFEQASVSISDVDICGDAIGIELGGTGLSGQLVVTLIAAASSHDIYEHSVSSGTHTIPFGWGGVPVGVEYTSVRATWSTCEPISDSENAHFMNLGVYTHTQYAAPDEREASCQGNQVTACFSTGPSACQKSVGSLHGRFADEARENGHGISIDHGNIQIEWLCTPPPGGCTRLTNYFRENVPSFTGACGNLSATTVAVDEGNDDLDCGDRVCIVGHGEKTVTDYGGEVGPTQLDHYLPGFNACDNPPDYCGATTTVKLYN